MSSSVEQALGVRFIQKPRFFHLKIYKELIKSSSNLYKSISYRINQEIYHQFDKTALLSTDGVHNPIMGRPPSANAPGTGAGPSASGRNDLHYAADSVSSAMSSLVRELNSG